ncbi:MAG: hypothetical protein KKD05_07395 [Candidatus Omnitrophica bacterium]|nr:hypothetical protein [Candidatus Omnitrophota bacterium]
MLIKNIRFLFFYAAWFLLLNTHLLAADFCVETRQDFSNLSPVMAISEQGLRSAVKGEVLNGGRVVLGKAGTYFLDVNFRRDPELRLDEYTNRIIEQCLAGNYTLLGNLLFGTVDFDKNYDYKKARKR